MKIIECPRDAMQGLYEWIPTEKKIRYLRQLLKVGFDTLDFGSFVSPKAIPQMQDTAEVAGSLDLSVSSTRLLAIIANLRGAQQAVEFDQITCLGFPLSVSETFQLRNTNKTIPQALAQLQEIQNLCQKKNKTLVTYISMGFGNPYGEPFSEEVVVAFAQKLVDLEIEIISLADTIGIAQKEGISRLFKAVIGAFPDTEIGAHFHATPHTAKEKIEAAYRAGCRRFDTAMRGFGGCPMAKDELTGNIATEALVSYFDETGIGLDLNREALEEAMDMAGEVFPAH